MSPSDAINQAVLLLVSGASDDAAVEACVKHGLPRPDAKAAVIDARRRITVAADYNRIEEVGTAYIRLHDLYRRSVEADDVKSALAAQKELNKLLDLYAGLQSDELEDVEDDASERGIIAAELAAVREHLLPLELAPEDYPIAEHARIAADLIRKRHEPAA
jgi:hypothetical protein